LPSLTFVHTADLHLDSPFKGVTAENAPHVSERLRRATFEVFEEIVALCIRERADFLLVAGDVYDGADRSLYAQMRFRDGLARLAEHGIHAFVVHGNHDPLSGWASHIEWPSTVTVFGNTVETVPFQRDGQTVAEITGVSYREANEGRNLARLFTRNAGDGASLRPSIGTAPFRVGLLHCNVGSDTGHAAYAPCELSDLINADIDYWALGHVHRNGVLATTPTVVYPGNPQGRSIRETGPRGCYVVRVDDAGHVTPRFHPVDAVRWTVVDIAIDDLDGMGALDTRTFARLDEALTRAEGRAVVCRLRFTGRGSLARELRRNDAVADIVSRCRERCSRRDPFLWVEKVEIDCRDDIDRTAALARPDLVGAVLRLAQTYREGDLAPLDSPLAELYENKKFKRYLSRPDPAELQQRIDEAALLCADLLEGSP